MSRAIFWVVLLGISMGQSAFAIPKTVLNLNVFDQLQGKWESDFRANRMAVLSKWIREQSPDLVVLQEAQGDQPGAMGGGADSSDTAALNSLYPFRKYVHEMTGADAPRMVIGLAPKPSRAKYGQMDFLFPVA
jgi:hypothetical protein